MLKIKDFIIPFFDFLGTSKEQAPYIIGLIIVVYAGYKIFKKLFDRFEDSLYDQIERLAAENRMYREIYLKRCKGLTDEDYEKLSAAPIEPSHGKRKTKGKRRRK